MFFTAKLFSFMMQFPGDFIKAFMAFFITIDESFECKSVIDIAKISFYSILLRRWSFEVYSQKIKRHLSCTIKFDDKFEALGLSNFRAAFVLGSIIVCSVNFRGET